MFMSALSSTPSASSGLTALASWILCCIGFVKLTLVFYVVILVRMKRLGKMTAPLQTSEKPPTDLDPLFLLIHFVAFSLFIVVCLLCLLA